MHIYKNFVTGTKQPEKSTIVTSIIIIMSYEEEEGHEEEETNAIDCKVSQQHLPSFYSRSDYGATRGSSVTHVYILS